MDKRIYRIIDANLNRAQEGLRVCEEITRFVLCNGNLTLALKKIRHQVVEATENWEIKKHLLLSSRSSTKDVGRPSIKTELKRTDYKDIFFANMQRVKESVRVLEEFAKLNNKEISENFKDIRYRLYAIEKKTIPKL